MFKYTSEHDKLPEKQSIDYDEIDKRLAGNIESNLREWFKDKKIAQSGAWWKIGNKGSLSVNAYDGHWTTFEDDNAGQGLLSLYAYRYNIDIKQAAEDLGDASNIVSFRETRQESPKAKEPEQWEHCSLPPSTITISHWEFGEADHVYKYSGRDGSPIGVVLRWDAKGDKEKTIRPVSWIQFHNKEQPEWKWVHFAEPRPLFRGEHINRDTDKPILIVEGESTAEAAAEMLPDFTVISWPQGSSGVGKADWSGLDDREVIIWPDNDEPGIKAANRIKSILPQSRIVQIEGKPEGWDLADAKAENTPIDWILEQIGSDDSELFVDLEAIFEGDMEPERPTIAASDSGECMLYAGRINEIHGEPSVGKTNITIALMACELRIGQKVIFIDPEDNPNGIIRRMLSFGISKEMIIANLYYLHDPTPEEMIKAQHWARRNKPSLVDVDGLAETITACRFKEDSSNEILEFFRTYIRPFTDCGAAVLLSDHVVKSSEGRGLWSRGSGAKMGRYDGVSYSVFLTAPYSPSQKGSVKFTIAKDRNGGLGTKGEDVFMAFFEPDGNGQTDISIRRLKPGDGFNSEIWEQLEAMHSTIAATATGLSAGELATCIYGIEDSSADDGFKRVTITDREKQDRRKQLIKLELIEERKEGKKKLYFATGKLFPSYK